MIDTPNPSQSRVISTPQRYYMGLDLGQSKDYTALEILERLPQGNGPALFNGVHMMRFPLGTRYPAIIADVAAMLQEDSLRGQCRLVIDASGVGRPVSDAFREAGVSHTPVTITGGQEVRTDKGMWYVRKRTLVATLQLLLQNERLKFAPNPLRDTLVKELVSFDVKISEAANDTYEGRSGEHDDLVLAVALAAWAAEGARAVKARCSTVRQTWI